MFHVWRTERPLGDVSQLEKKIPFNQTDAVSLYSSSKANSCLLLLTLEIAPDGWDGDRHYYYYFCHTALTEFIIKKKGGETGAKEFTGCLYSLAKRLCLAPFSGPGQGTIPLRPWRGHCPGNPEALMGSGTGWAWSLLVQSQKPGSCSQRSWKAGPWSEWLDLVAQWAADSLPLALPDGGLLVTQGGSQSSSRTWWSKNESIMPTAEKNCPFPRWRRVREPLGPLVDKVVGRIRERRRGRLRKGWGSHPAIDLLLPVPCPLCIHCSSERGKCCAFSRSPTHTHTASLLSTLRGLTPGLSYLSLCPRGSCLCQ